MTERQADEVVSFDLDQIPSTLKVLRAIQQKCKEKRGEIVASKQGVNELRITCIWQEAFVTPEDMGEEPDEVEEEEG